MAAYAALVSLMRVIHDLETHPSPPISLDKQLLDSIAQRITFFQQFLHSYISSPVADDDEEEVADPWEMRIAASAHSAEDAIESHIVDSIKQKRDNNKANDAEKINRCCTTLESVIEEMDSIKKAVVVVDTVQKTKKPLVVVPITDARSETLVGSDAIVLEIMEKLAGGQLDCQVIPIVGMGGIGKTFLAKTIYAKPLIKERFDICAWATISQNYDAREILRELLSQATNTKKEQLMSGKSEDEVGLDLHKYLSGRRFLIVMDDMWSIEAWDKVQRFFPDKENSSRVMVTTRLSQLSSQLNNDYSLCMSFLDEASSWDLFSETVFGEKGCPPELEEIGEQIVDNCRGLPLSISVVGGLLKKMDGTRASWESVRDNFNSVVNMKNDKHCLRLLKLSYNHLPIYLKPCFLYMGVFEEDEEIRVSTLVQLWVSEGFLKPTNGEALETTARGFLQDLIDRNLILIGKLGSTGSLRFCRMHDLVRDMCMKEGQKEGFYHFIGKRNPAPPQEGRVVIPKNASKEKVCGDLRFMSRTRSIICEHGKVALCRNLVLLRTLHAQNKHSPSDDESCLKSLVFRYVNLRHLSIKARCNLSFLPSVSLLWNLHTLVVSYSFEYKPATLAEFWNMPQFRHIQFVDDCVCLLDPPNCDGDAVVVMEHLHTLKGIRNFKCSESVVKRIPNIKRLNLEYNRRIDYVDDHSDDDDDDDDDGDDDDDDDDDDDEDNDSDDDDDDDEDNDSDDDDDDDNDSEDDDDVYFVGNLKNLCGLEFLTVTFSPVGPISPMQKITFPHSLKKLTLYMEFGFEWDNMLERVGSLPLLEKLQLSGGRFGKGKWEIAEGQFPSLKYLQLFKCEGLENWTASEEDSSILSRLEHLKLYRLYDLKKIPFELGNIDTLKTIMIINSGEGAVKSAKEMFDEQVDLQGGEDQLSFYVEVYVSHTHEQNHLLSFAGPKFYVMVNPS